jgi:hypothetical protein
MVYVGQDVGLGGRMWTVHCVWIEIGKGKGLVEVTSVESIQVEVVVEGGGGGGGGGGGSGGGGVEVWRWVWGLYKLRQVTFSDRVLRLKKPSFNSRDSTLMYC